jgi:hypothetical protein
LDRCLHPKRLSELNESQSQEIDWSFGIGNGCACFGSYLPVFIFIPGSGRMSVYGQLTAERASWASGFSGIRSELSLAFLWLHL